ncbi:MAG: hypothetical protein ACPLKQ_06000 [Candidatus Bathyarchaeales archaeon]
MGSNPTPCTYTEPTNVKLVNFALWLRKRGNRESTIERKIKYLKALRGSVEDMFLQVLSKSWSDKSKECALETVKQYAEFLGFKVQKPNFKAYDNNELYVPTPDMIKRFIYRVRDLKLKACIMIAVETGASSAPTFQFFLQSFILFSCTIATII